jgi:hypothetical protein
VQATVYPAGIGKARISFAYHSSGVLHRITSIARLVLEFAADFLGVIAMEFHNSSHRLRNSQELLS